MTSELKQRVDSRLHRIANILLLNSSFIRNLGLFDGKMAIAIFFYNYSRYTNNDVYQTYAGELIDEIFDEINTRMSINFAHGLTGIGWGIEYLVQNGFLEADTDEVLEEIDEAVYKKILLQPACKELQGCLLYQLARFKAENNGNSQKELLKKHTLLCLLDECEKLLVYRNFKENVAFPDSDIIKSVAFFLMEVNKLSIFPQKTQRLLECIPSFLEITKTAKDKEIGNEALVDQEISHVWDNLVYSTTSVPESQTLLFTQAFKLIDDEDSWKQRINNLKSNKFQLGQELASSGMYLLKNIPPENLKPDYAFDEKVYDEENKLQLFIVAHYVSGAKTYVDALASYFSTRDDVDLYIVFIDSQQYEELTINKIGNISQVYIPNNFLSIYNNKFDRQIALLIYSQFNTKKRKIFHMNYENQFMLSVEIKKLFNCPIIFTVHFLRGMFSYFDKGFSNDINKLITDKQVLKNMLDFSDRIICVTQFSQRMVTNVFGISSDKVCSIYNGNDETIDFFPENRKSQLKEDLGFRANERIILYAGRLETGKGVDKLISSFLKLNKEIEDLKLVIVGDGDFREFFPFAKECPGKICFIGKVEKKEIYQLYQIAEIGVIPSRFEQCSYVAIEMMQHGLPLIISDVPGLNELVTHEVNGLVCKVVAREETATLEPDEEDLVLQIKKLLIDEGLKKYIKRNSLETANRIFNLTTMGEKSLAVYRKALNRMDIKCESMISS